MKLEIVAELFGNLTY